MGTLLRIAGCIPAYPTKGKRPLLSVPAGASKRETPTSNLTESTDLDFSFNCFLVPVSLFLLMWTMQGSKNI